MGTRSSIIVCAMTAWLCGCGEREPPAASATRAAAPAGPEHVEDAVRVHSPPPRAQGPVAAQWVGVARAHEGSKDLRAAVEAWSAAIAAEPTNGSLHVARANARAGLGEVDGVLDDYRVAAALGRIEVPQQLWDWRRARWFAAGRKRPDPDIRLLYAEVQYLLQRRFIRTVDVETIPDGDAFNEAFHDPLDHLHEAFYFPRRQTIVMRSGMTAGVEGESVLVHELAHALDHQLHPRIFEARIETYEEVTWDLDRDLARSCVLEGSARLAQWTWSRWTTAGVPPTDDSWLAPENLAAYRAEALAVAPESVATETRVAYLDWFRRMAPYGAGSVFMAAVRCASGPGGIDAVLEKPPRSTDQILHPEKYLGRVDDPSFIRIEVAPSLTGCDRTRAETLGELGLAAILRRRGAAAADALAAVEGWDGDLYFEFRRQAGGDDPHPFVILSVWDDPEAAARFAKAIQTGVPAPNHVRHEPGSTCVVAAILPADASGEAVLAMVLRAQVTRRD